MTNTLLLKAEIEKSGYKLVFVAKQTGITYQALLKKINNETEFKASEIAKLCELLKIDIQKQNAIFFA